MNRDLTQKFNTILFKIRSGSMCHITEISSTVHNETVFKTLAGNGWSYGQR